MNDIQQGLANAVRQFWETLRVQSEKQGAVSGSRDRGNRAAATGGAQMNGFAALVKSLLVESGISEESVFLGRDVILPGFYRPTKNWDLVVVVNEQLLAVVEFKSHVGPSFSNNFNNRTEEAIGSAADIWAAYREGAFKLSQRPWLGYFLLLEEEARSTRSIRVAEPHFRVFEEFRDASYAKRYELLCLKLVRERLYDSACFLMSDRAGGMLGQFREPSPELIFRDFITSLIGKTVMHAKLRPDA